MESCLWYLSCGSWLLYVLRSGFSFTSMGEIAAVDANTACVEISSAEGASETCAYHNPFNERCRSGISEVAEGGLESGLWRWRLLRQSAAIVDHLLGLGLLFSRCAEEKFLSASCDEKNAPISRI